VLSLLVNELVDTAAVGHALGGLEKACLASEEGDRSAAAAAEERGATGDGSSLPVKARMRARTTTESGATPSTATAPKSTPSTPTTKLSQQSQHPKRIANHPSQPLTDPKLPRPQ